MHRSRLLPPADIIVLLVAMSILAGLYGTMWGGDQGADIAIIQVANRAPIEVPLARDARFTVDGHLGPATIEINKQRIRFAASACQQKICIRSGWHRHAGDSAVCMPNRVSAQVASTHRHYDAVSF